MLSFPDLSAADLSITDLAALNQRLANTPPPVILRWIWETFAANIAATSSFQTQSVPLLHMIAQATPRLPVYFVDTGFHFPETLAFRDRLTAEFGVNLKIVRPVISQAAFLAQYGELYLQDSIACCAINKVQPWQAVASHLPAWIAGLRRDQTGARRQTPIVAREPTGRYKICPLAAWSSEMVEAYRNLHRLPAHPLDAQGYRSIGCRPCTRPVQADEAERAGRWPGQGREECGLHFPQKDW